MEKIGGIQIDDTEGLINEDYDLKDIAEKLTSSYVKQVLDDGFFHADPHPGNLLVMQDHVIGLLDCGQVGRLDANARNGLIRLLVAFEHEDPRQFAETIVVLGISQGDVDLKLLTRDLEKLLRQYYDIPSRSINLGAIITRTLDTSARHRVRLPSSFALLGKVIANVDSVAGRLDPNFNFTEAAKPYISRAVRQEFNLSNLSTDLYRTVIDLKTFLLRLPENVEQIVRKMVEGSFRLEVKHDGIADVVNKLDRAINRLVFALIIVGVIIGSSLVVVAGRGPSGWYGFPMMGIVGYVIATVLGLYLVFQIMRSRRLH
jgi:ubiquinone biosynthesis protein